MENYVKMVTILLAFLGILQLHLPLAFGQGFQCQTPEGQFGQCISIWACNPLLNLLQTQREAAAKYLRSTHCGFDDRGPMVCCPNEVNPNPVPPKKDEMAAYEVLRPPHCGFSNASHTRVVGGIPAELGAWPWIVVMGYRSSKNPGQTRWLCGGSLISKRHILTAGHCVYGRNDLFKVRLGDLDLVSDFDGAHPIEIEIANKVVHPGYSSTTFVNDIAVLTLAEDVPFSDLLHPVCLPVDDKIRQRDLSRTYPFIAGWGSVDYKGPSSNQLMELQIPVVNTESCKQAFTRFNTAIIDNRVLCAGYARGGKDACQGDSGGPMILPCGNNIYCQIGVVSYGYRCAEPGYPGIYTRVTEFLDFIIGEMNK